MNKKLIRRAGAVLGAAALVATMSACSTKADGGSAEAGDVLTGAGISGDTITLGLLGDLTGPFAALTTEMNNGSILYWNEANAAGGVCGTYQVAFDTKDHGYNVQNSVSMYNQMTPNVLAYQALVGGSQTAAVLDQAEADHRLIVPSSATEHLAQSDVILTPAMLYNLDAELVLEYMLEQGTIAEGDTIGMVYLEGDYGESAHVGVQAFAERHDITLVDSLVKPTDSDMTSAVNNAVSQGATAFFIASVPAHTSSVATVLEAAGEDVAMAGSWPSYTASLMNNTGGQYLQDHFTAGSMATTFDLPAGEPIITAYEAEFGSTPETNQVPMGYGTAAMMHQILDRACELGDLTPEGVVAAKNDLGTLTSDGVMPDMDYTELGKSPTVEEFIIKLDSEAPGGIASREDGPYSNPAVTND
ncbi:ABC transporter substrate-binding protein [Gulosibacter molinativorax]|uniref:ABC transporter substrate-binding protein n=1 Tax=Gulosibacter molinativorax TaxID=256821 RepID=A0ABT7CBA0_9MICO|nr:ABC transporter substrate-binding protein [Gulosibacter molinativorax]MDJ1372473.1 ABC transporter substrate-binding protein [Gulosibacter molinativorax]QUY61950.1 Hypotetical protein [Gulosibacter molinativorax]